VPEELSQFLRRFRTDGTGPVAPGLGLVGANPAQIKVHVLAAYAHELTPPHAGVERDEQHDIKPALSEPRFVQRVQQFLDGFRAWALRRPRGSAVLDALKRIRIEHSLTAQKFEELAKNFVSRVSGPGTAGSREEIQGGLSWGLEKIGMGSEEAPTDGTLVCQRGIT
jgi:hypothetical protein